MLKGYSRPFSPSGKASLVTPTPHSYGGNVITVTFRAPEEVVRKFVPPPLKPVPGGICSAFVADWVCVGADNPGLVGDNPERTQYQEGQVDISVEHNGVKGKFPLTVWTTKDWSMVYGWMVGFPKKIARVHMTRIAEINPALKPLGIGSKLRGIVDRHGRRILDLGIEITAKETDPGERAGMDLFMIRHFPGFGPQAPPVCQLIWGTRSQEAVVVRDLWSGKGSITLGDSENEEVSLLQPVEVLSATYAKRGWMTHHPSRVIRTYSPEEFEAFSTAAPLARG